MSTMWGLTGSLDARLVSDSKSADVTFDAAPAATSSSGSGKSGASQLAAAEVAVQGTINGERFEVVRRRGAKKAELHFSV